MRPSFLKVLSSACHKTVYLSESSSLVIQISEQNNAQNGSLS